MDEVKFQSDITKNPSFGKTKTKGPQMTKEWIEISLENSSSISKKALRDLNHKGYTPIVTRINKENIIINKLDDNAQLLKQINIEK